MVKSKAYVLINSGLLIRPTGLRVSSSHPFAFYGITTENDLIPLGSIATGDINFPRDGKKIVVLYYEMEKKISSKPVVTLLLGDRVMG